jgi:hypothetical protein
MHDTLAVPIPQQTEVWSRYQAGACREQCAAEHCLVRAGDAENGQARRDEGSGRKSAYIRASLCCVWRMQYRIMSCSMLTSLSIEYDFDDLFPTLDIRLRISNPISVRCRAECEKVVHSRARGAAGDASKRECRVVQCYSRRQNCSVGSVFACASVISAGCFGSDRSKQTIRVDRGHDE